MCTKDFQVVITDFNVAKARPRSEVNPTKEEQPKGIEMDENYFDVSDNETEENPFNMYTQQRGTLAFAAPERLKDSAIYNEKIDMWAAGIVLYMLVAGTYPFEEEGKTNSLDDLMKNINNGEERIINLMEEPEQAHMSAEVKDLIRRLVRKDVTKRLSAASSLNHEWFDVDFNTAKQGEQKLSHIRSVLATRSIRKSVI